MKALRVTRHCMICSKDYGCKDENEVKSCKSCHNEPDYCGSSYQDETTGICDHCFSTRKDQVVRQFQ